MRRAWFIGLGLIVMALLGVRAWVQRPPEPQHVIVISLDTTRADALGPWGGSHTPAVDRLAAEGVVFERHYSAAPTTLASHTSLMTGRWPHTHGVPRNDYLVHEDNVFLAELLRDLGWRTAAFLGAIPLASHSGFPQGFDHVDAAFTLHRSADGVAQTERPGASVTAATLSWLDANPVAPDDRLLLFVHYFDAHSPYGGGPASLAAHGLTPSDAGGGNLDAIARARKLVRTQDPKADAAVERLTRLYRSGVTEADAALGALLDGLDQRGLLDTSLIVLTADHGETFATHDEVFDHGETVYDETVHTPLILRFPAAWSAGWRTAGIVSNVDVLPTLLDLLGVPHPEGVDGRSLAPLLRGDLLRTSASAVFAEATKPHVKDRERWQNHGMRKAIITPDAKLHLDPRRGVIELYDLPADPGELHDLQAERPAQAAELRAALVDWTRTASPLPSDRISSARVKAELALLGYLDATEPDHPEPEAPPEAPPDAP